MLRPRMLGLALTLAFFCVVSGSADQSHTAGAAAAMAAKVSVLAWSKTWLRLLHYRRSFPWYAMHSQADGSIGNSMALLPWKGLARIV